MHMGRRIKNCFGIEPSVDLVSFKESGEHLILTIKCDGLSISHKQVNAVLNRYLLGDKKTHWIFMYCNLGALSHVPYDYGGVTHELPTDWFIISTYRLDRNTAMKQLKMYEEIKILESGVEKKVTSDKKKSTKSSDITIISQS